jgi:hypothetical protein
MIRSCCAENFESASDDSGVTVGCIPYRLPNFLWESGQSLLREKAFVFCMVEPEIREPESGFEFDGSAVASHKRAFVRFAMHAQ